MTLRPRRRYLPGGSRGYPIIRPFARTRSPAARDQTQWEGRVISVVLSILFGLLPLAVATPVVLPVIGLALGLNAIVKQWRATPRRPRVYWLAIAGIVASAVSTVLTMIGVHLHAA